MYNPLLLVIDDEDSILKALKDTLEDEQYRVQTLQDPTQAISLIGQLIPDLIFLDILMPQKNGIDLLQEIKNEYPDQKIIMISGFGNIPLALKAIKCGAIDFIEKPLNLDEILEKISFLKKADKQNAIKDVESSTYEQYGIVGKSYLFQELMRQVDLLLPLSLPVLIYGQPGTGKSLLASYIHKQAKKSERKFTILDCTKQKTSDEMFHAFQEPGTVYLKNICQAHAGLQDEILHAIGQRHNDCRIIASSSKSLFNLVQQGKFNSLLFHKLNVTPLEVPPLDKRRYDIPLLINHFVEQFSGEKKFVIAASALRQLRNFGWIGNVAMLKSTIQRLVCSIEQDYFVIDNDSLINFLPEKSMQFVEEQSFTSFSSLQDATITFEKKFLLYQLKKNRYDLDQVSQSLHLNIGQLRAKMLELNIEY